MPVSPWVLDIVVDQGDCQPKPFGKRRHALRQCAAWGEEFVAVT